MRYTNMKKTETHSEISRREAMKLLTAGSAAGLLGLLEPGNPEPKFIRPILGSRYASCQKLRCRLIATAPEGSNLIIVKSGYYRTRVYMD